MIRVTRVSRVTRKHANNTQKQKKTKQVAQGDKMTQNDDVTKAKRKPEKQNQKKRKATR